MQKSTASTFVKGAVTGMITGAALFTAGKMVMDKNHNLSKGSTKAIKAVGEFVDGVHTMFK